MSTSNFLGSGTGMPGVFYSQPVEEIVICVLSPEYKKLWDRIKHVKTGTSFDPCIQSVAERNKAHSIYKLLMGLKEAAEGDCKYWYAVYGIDCLTLINLK